MSALTREGLLKAIATLHEQVSSAASKLSQPGGATLNCRAGCNACCIDGLSVSWVEAELIRTMAAEVLAGEPHPPGACAFLTPDGLCSIYEFRPQVCRTQGLPLQWLEADGDQQLVYRDICPLNEDLVDLQTLPEHECWHIGAVEERLALLNGLAERAGFSDGRRVKLRELFSPE